MLKRPYLVESIHQCLSSFKIALINFTEVVAKKNPQASSPEMKAAIISEVKDNFQWWKFKIILIEEVRDGVRTSTARTV